MLLLLLLLFESAGYGPIFFGASCSKKNTNKRPTLDTPGLGGPKEKKTSRVVTLLLQRKLTMETEQQITVLLKRVWQLESLIEVLLVELQNHRSRLDSGPDFDRSTGSADMAMDDLHRPEPPYNLFEKCCQDELVCRLTGTKWESFTCPDCGSWYFPIRS